MKTILGGGGSSGSSSQTGGFNQLPESIRKAFEGLGSEAQKWIGQQGYDAFKPIGQTDAETRALNMINRGFTPTQDSLNADIAMQMNPFDSSVIDTINREARGQNSILNQALSQAGQFGSNRQMLGANDIDLTRLNQIGTFKQSQFNNALQNALNIMPQSRRQDASGMMAGGEFQRNLGLQQSTAPIQSLQALAQILGVLPKVEGSSSSTSSTKGGGNGIGGLVSAAGQAYTAFSDRSLKENIEPFGQKNGFNLYKFNYIGDDIVHIGVMADEVELIMPEAVSIIDGFKAVDYSLIGIEMKEVENG